MNSSSKASIASSGETVESDYLYHNPRYVTQKDPSPHHYSIQTPDLPWYPPYRRGSVPVNDIRRNDIRRGSSPGIIRRPSATSVSNIDPNRRKPSTIILRRDSPILRSYASNESLMSYDSPSIQSPRSRYGNSCDSNSSHSPEEQLGFQNMHMELFGGIAKPSIVSPRVAVVGYLPTHIPFSPLKEEDENRSYGTGDGYILDERFGSL
jgi:hypothetical protein